MNFNRKTVWITGASSGIGEAVAFQLAEQCDTLILSGRNVTKLNQTADILAQKSVTTKVVAFDLGDELDVVRAFNEVKRLNIRIDALLQFGGLSHRSLVVDTNPDVERKIMEVNYFGTVLLAKMMLKDMIKQGGGLLAVTSSIVGKFGFPYRSSYSAAKHALHGYFETIRAENKDKNITVSIIIPGRVATSISMHALLSNGKMHGKMDEGIENGMDVNKAAKIIYKKLSKNKNEIMVGGKELLMVHIRRWIPTLAYYLASKVKPT